MDEYAFQVRGPVAPGRVVVQATNTGHLDHELVLVVLPEGEPPIGSQLRAHVPRVLETVAILPARRPGTGGTLAVDLEAGRYALLCFVKDGDGVEHALKGMSTELRVS